MHAVRIDSQRDIKTFVNQQPRLIAFGEGAESRGEVIQLAAFEVLLSELHRADATIKSRVDHINQWATSGVRAVGDAVQAKVEHGDARLFDAAIHRTGGRRIEFLRHAARQIGFATRLDS